MDDFPTKIAEALESTALRIRSMTVDRVAGWITWTAAGIVIAMIALVAVIFLLVGLFRLLGELIGFELTYAIVGGLFVVTGMFLWSKRKPTAAKD